MSQLTVVMVNFLRREDSPDNQAQKWYSYFTDEELKVGDYVAVEARSTFGVAQVVQVNGITPHQHASATRWVVCKLDLEQLQKRREKALLMFDIKARLQQARAEFEERRVYELLAKDDPKIAELLSKYTELCGESYIATKPPLPTPGGDEIP